ncbi:MarR family winged helix-turn-helix transcriptional regulator [Desulfosporosinus youngiae]|uniref:Transcriptional regulator n=1 Tax=Desulfosporosinus youngiae DSM 17734 TaxID=768710 RepID=H5Y2Z2_9FIRM|nr:MarR family transcriptional regulator [Desulfosporosinus youngiae]EHQ88549.1 transcriptional regulator [Desulfosporosinus youngiae DSM 17734]
MDFNKAKQIHCLLFSFVGLFYEKVFIGFRQESKCDSSLKKNHKKILNILYLHDKLTITEISKLSDIEKGSLTTLIDLLEEKGYITRLTDPADRRKSLISLSDNGKKEMERVMNYFAQRMNESLHKFSSDEIQKFQNNLEYVVDLMKKL